MRCKILRISLLCVSALLLTWGATPSFAAKVVPSSEVSREKLLKKMNNKEDDLRSFCSGMEKCLDIKYGACTENDMKPWPKVNYDQEFCAPYKEIVKRGFSTNVNSPMMVEVFLRLGRQYRAIYSSEGTLPLEVSEISYLFDNMPFTADLINAYLDSKYELQYNSTDRRYFSGNNGNGLSGDFYWALSDSAGTKLMLRNLFFGYGYAQILKWSLKGTAIAYLDMDLIAPRTLKYKLTAIVFPGNSVLNSIMQLRVFKSVVNSKIDDVVNDVNKAANMYYGGNRRPILSNPKLQTPENARHIAEFDKVVAGSPWKLGDALRKERAQLELSKPPTPVKNNEPVDHNIQLDSTDAVEPEESAKSLSIKKD